VGFEGLEQGRNVGVTSTTPRRPRHAGPRDQTIVEPSAHGLFEPVSHYLARALERVILWQVES